MKLFTPRPYQKEITQFILDNPRCSIWAGMGLGKTGATLEALSVLEVLGEGPVLVLAPLRVCRSVWPQEIEKWVNFNHLKISVVAGTATERVKALQIGADIYCTNFENIPWLVQHFEDKWPFKIIVCDEATRLKSLRISVRESKTGKRYLQGQGGKRAKSIAKIAYQNVDRWINLTGTPAPNGIIDVWAQLWFCDFGKRLGNSFTAYTQRWFDLSYDGYTLTPKSFAQKQIEESIKDICLSLRAEDHFDLDKPIKNIIRVELPEKARKIYKQMEREFFLSIGGHNIEAFNAAAKSVKLLQLCNGAIYTDDKQNYEEVHDAKIEALESIVSEAGGSPVLVAYHFKSDLDRLQRAFPKAVTLDHRDKTIRDWNARKIPVLFAHPASAGHGLNLAEGGNILVFFGVNWDLELHDQIIERIGPVRQFQAGLRRSVFLYYILAEDTIDEDVVVRLESKKSVQDTLLEAMRR